MSKKIIVLERVAEPSDQVYRIAFWLDVPATRGAFFADANLTSQYKNATPQEIQNIKDGKIKEVVETVNYIAGMTMTNVQAHLIQKYNQLQNELNTRNPFIRYGTNWDGVSWTAGGVI